MTSCKEMFFALMFTILMFLVQGDQEEWTLQNLDNKCMDCLCEAATECNVARGCVDGYCGPYKVSRIYWVDAGNITMPLDESNRAGAYEDCANNFYCAKKIVTSYLTKYGKDCNGDGVTDCYDYMMINFNGGWSCTKPLSQDTRAGLDWLQRYTECINNTE